MAYITEFDQKKTYSVGESNSDIKNIQIALKGLGYYDDKISKEYTEKVKQAVEAYQEKNQLAVTGKVDAKTMRSIEQNVIKTLAKNDPALEKAQKVVNDEK
nr:peptidoglycan-binding domain-containing protein [Pediococcus pentosaceus]